MVTSQIVQGRSISADDLALIHQLLAQSPLLSRRQLSIQLATRWNWRNPNGQLKDMAARSLLLKLQARGLIALPPRQRRGGRQTPPAQFALPLHRPTEPITGALALLRPLQVRPLAPRQPETARFGDYLARYHYLGYRGPVGHHLAYLVQDARGRDLACVLFGAAAWRCAPRDRFLGWSDQQRRERLHWIANNSRFLVLPWVQVPHLASHLLGAVLRRLRADWGAKYAQPLLLVETFVEHDRFAATCYRAANWIEVGRTQGRSRQDRDHSLRVPIKAVYLYPLWPHFRRLLGA